MSLGKDVVMHGVLNIIIKLERIYFPIASEFRKTIVHPLNHKNRAGMPYSERGWNKAIEVIIWEDYEFNQ